MTTQFVFFLHHNRACCFKHETGTWQLHRLKGEASVELRGRQPLQPLLQDLSDQINATQALENVPIHVFYGQETVDTLKNAIHDLLQLKCKTWQILQMEPLVARAQAKRPFPTPTNVQSIFSLLGDSDKTTLNWVCQVLLPIVSSTFFYTDLAMASELKRDRKSQQIKHSQHQKEEEETLESLRKDRQNLVTQIQNLQQQVQVLQSPSMEHLLTFLPVIYRNFFGAVSPEELALLAGTLQVPEVPSPFPDPSPDTVYVKRQQFLSLPADDQTRIRGFCRQLTHHQLKVRTEMEFIFGENN